MTRRWPFRKPDPAAEWQAPFGDLARWFAPYDILLPISPVTPALTVLLPIRYQPDDDGEPETVPQFRALRQEPYDTGPPDWIRPRRQEQNQRAPGDQRCGGTAGCPACGAHVPVGQDGVPLAHQRFADGSGYGPDRPHERVTCEGRIPWAVPDLPSDAAEPIHHNGW